MKVWSEIHDKPFTWMAQQLGKSKQEIDNVAAGRYKTGDVVEGVASIMKCSKEWLLYGVGEPPEWCNGLAGAPTIPGLFQSVQAKQVRIPGSTPVGSDRPMSRAAILTAPVSTMPTHHASAGFPTMAWVGQVTAGGGYADPSQDDDDWLPVVLKPNWRLVRVQGTSAMPVLLPGQAAIVDDTVPVRDGRLVVVQTTDGRAYLKRWNTVGEHVVLAGLNGGNESTVLRLDQIAKVAVVVGTLYVDSVAK